MKTKFWLVYFLAVLPLICGIYFATAESSDVPLALSSTQMEQLLGSDINWACNELQPCSDIPCDNNTLESWEGFTGCHTCEYEPNEVCYKKTSYCVTCKHWQYDPDCNGTMRLVGEDNYRDCTSGTP